MLFDLYYDFVCKYTYYCNNMRQINRIQTPITGTVFQQYIITEYDIRTEISTTIHILSS